MESSELETLKSENKQLRADIDLAIEALADIRNKTILIRSHDVEYNIGTLKQLHMIAKDALAKLQERK